MEQVNKAAVTRWMEVAWNQRRAEVIDELLTAESVCHADEGDLVGPDQFRDRQYGPFLAAFPDLRIQIEEMVAQGDAVVTRWVATGTHTQEGMGFKATAEPATFRGVTWVRLKDGKFVEGWQHSNIPEVVRGLASRAPA